MDPKTIEFTCADGTRLIGHWWQASATPPHGMVVINPATGVLARYYHRYAAFLSANGFAAFTYDYRGIGQSRPVSLAGSTFTWREWGTQDFTAALQQALDRGASGPVHVVGHSIGGFLPGYAATAGKIATILSVGGQFGYWGDYALARRLPLFLKWHLAMPMLTGLTGYFPGRRLGWLEDLPKDVAYGWGLQQARAEQGLSTRAIEEMQAGFAAVMCPILSVTMTDDEIATPKAIHRAMRYYPAAAVTKVLLSPQDIGMANVGHFDLFHARHEETFWKRSLDWLREGRNPWPDRVYP